MGFQFNYIHLNLHLKIKKVIKRIFTAISISAFIFSCNNGTDKPGELKEDEVKEGIKEERNSNLIYLDTAENIYNILCQDWVLADDAEGLEGMDENSKFEIPYRSFYLSTQGSFVKNPRSTFDYGNWDFNDARKNNYPQ